MVFHMKTTMMIDDGVMLRLREEAARQGRTLSELIEAALRRFLEPPPSTQTIEALPLFHAGAPLVDVADRDALEEAMGE